MIYLFAAIGVIAVIWLMWRAFGPQSAHSTGGTAPRSGPVGPDDDPEFLHDLRRRSSKPTDPDER